jgi:membrane protein
MSNLPANTQGYFSRFSITVISLSSSFIMFFLLFRFVPNKKLPRKTLFTSIILSVILVELSRNAFGWYIATVANYGKFYGAYAIVASMAIWVYYLIFIVLLSAEIAQFRYDILSRKYD